MACARYRFPSNESGDPQTEAFSFCDKRPEEDTGMWCSSEGLEIPSELRSSVLKMFTALWWGLKPLGREGC